MVEVGKMFGDIHVYGSAKMFGDYMYKALQKEKLHRVKYVKFFYNPLYINNPFIIFTKLQAHLMYKMMMIYVK